ncbi:hypothetical protein KKA14_11920 [bacterium]|nr:hypothetical protein [bacterium]
MKWLYIPAMLALFLTTRYTDAKAEFYFSAGVPLNYTFTGENYNGETFKTEKVSGRLFHAHLSTLFGLGIESYEIALKETGYSFYDQSVAITMYDLFYVLPIPGLLFTVGAGFGETEMKCINCGDYFNKGQARQLYLQVGYPFASFMDVHLSYHMISSTLVTKIEGNELDLSGTNIALGFGISF